jgi:nucleotide-binding universal stress UspA family protein
MIEPLNSDIASRTSGTDIPRFPRNDQTNMKMKQILVATDFSTRSDRALRRATLLAKQYAVPLTIVHVIDDDRHAFLVEAENKSSSALLEDLSETIRKSDGIECTASSLLGSAFEKIAEKSEEIAADLTVIGPHRRHVLRDMLVGTTAERIIRANRGPTLIANAAPTRPYRNILAPVDMSDCSADALRGLSALGLMAGAKVSVLHIFDTAITRGRTGAYMSRSHAVHHRASVQARSESELSDFLAGCKFHPSETIVRPNELPAHYVIDMVARDMSADLIVMGTHGRSGFANFVLGSVTRDMLAISDIDMLVVSPQARTILTNDQNAQDR